MTNEQLYRKAGQIPISEEIRHRQLKFLGHILRMDKYSSDEPANIYALYESKIKTNNRVGGHRKSYRDQIADYLALDKKDPELRSQINILAHGPDWNKLIAAPKKPAR